MIIKPKFKYQPIDTSPKMELWFCAFCNHPHLAPSQSYICNYCNLARRFILALRGEFLV